jgi:hypothetical protein
MPQVAAIYIQNPTRELIERDFRLSVCPTSVAVGGRQAHGRVFPAVSL